MAADIRALLEKYVIRCRSEEARVYAFTDRVGGFWDGRTFARSQGEGYLIGGRRYLKDLFLFADTALLDPAQAQCVELWPHQAVQSWADGITVAWTVLPGEHGLIVTMKAERPVVWSVIPLFHGIIADERPVQDGRILQVAQEPVDRIAALRMDVSSKWTMYATSSRPSSEPGACMHQAVSKPVPECSLIILFGTNRKALEARVTVLSEDPDRTVQDRAQGVAKLLQQSQVETNDPELDQALAWAKISANELVVTEFKKGIWAGLPWFHQGWGRDTFISLPGTSIVTGQFADAADIIRGFAAYQILDPGNPLYGRIPNRVCSPTDIIYNTTDGTPWLIREIAEYVLWTGDKAFAAEMLPVVRRAIDGALKYFTDEFGFMTHDDADTWMDARLEGKEAWSPRGNRAVDIQALWHTQLEAGAWLARLLRSGAEADDWQSRADQVKSNFRRYFTDADHQALYDHLNTDGSPDHQIRPNQLFALTVPLFSELIDSPMQAGVVRQVVSELAYPHGVASLSQNDPLFHPHHHNQIYYFDAAYHNGLCWQWNAGPTIGGMVKTGQSDLAFELTKNLAGQILHEGMPGSLSELVEPFKNAEGRLVLSGTYSQAWSVAEFVRNFYQDYLGLRVDMTQRRISVEPRFPKALHRASLTLTAGAMEQMKITWEASGMMTLTAVHLNAPVIFLVRLADTQRTIREVPVSLAPGATRRLEVQDWKTMLVALDDRIHVAEKTVSTLPAPDPALHFQTPRQTPDRPTLTIPHFLQNKIRPAFPTIG